MSAFIFAYIIIAIHLWVIFGVMMICSSQTFPKSDWEESWHKNHPISFKIASVIYAVLCVTVMAAAWPILLCIFLGTFVVSKF